MTNRVNKGSLFPFLEYETSVVASETEGVTQRILDVTFLRRVEGEVDAVVDVLVGILRVMVDGRRDDTVFECHHAGDCLYGSRRADQVAGHRLGGVQGSCHRHARRTHAE